MSELVLNGNLEMHNVASIDVLRMADIDISAVAFFLADQGLTLSQVDPNLDIPGSHWGDDEAGLISNVIYARPDTPVHSLLHESCHWLLMTDERRSNLHTDAGGSSVEECAVCYLQILLADRFPPMTVDRMFIDMDSWGYSFRMGSTRHWFEQDAEDAIEFLLNSRVRNTELLRPSFFTDTRS